MNFSIDILKLVPKTRN